MMRSVLACVCVLAAGVVWAVPTGLNIIPTAQVLDFNQPRLEYESDGSGKLYVPITSSLFGSQSGLGYGLEGGIDSVSDKGTVYNVKWRFWNEGVLTPALAIGAQNITSGEKIQYYLVGTKSLAELVAVHGGVLRDEDGDLVTLLGANVDLGILRVQADSAQGGGFDRTSIGGSVRYRGFTAGVTQYDYDTGRDERTFTLMYSP